TRAASRGWRQGVGDGPRLEEPHLRQRRGIDTPPGTPDLGRRPRPHGNHHAPGAPGRGIAVMEAILNWILRSVLLLAGAWTALLLWRWIRKARRSAVEPWPLRV